ncbi:MAG: hypothetical protein ACI8TA_003247, partial [Cyclobacteriaceae bacterium]
CNDEDSQIPSVEERKAAATKELVDELTGSANGWRLDYRPTPSAGTFLIILNFDENGQVRIQSDVAVNEGKFLDQTISYRIDHDLATELILETYGVFHYLFELNQNSFGAEFEFLYQGKSGDNLIFRSKSDGVDEITTLIFSPADASSAGLISTEITEQLATGGFRLGELAGIGANTSYQWYLPSDDISIFGSFDLGNRRFKAHGASKGYTFDEVLNSNQSTEIQSVHNISFIDEQVVLGQAVSFSLDGKNYSFSTISPSNFVQSDTAYCVGQSDKSTSFDAALGDISSIEMRSTNYVNYSLFFDEEDEFYAQSYVFMYDENDSSLAETLEESFENIELFLLIYNSTPRGYSDGTFTGLGFLSFDENDDLQWYLREMNILKQNGNYLEFELTDGTFINVADSLDERNALFDLTDQIFEGGKLYASEVLSFEDLYEVYNPCNDYHFYLFE